MSKITSSVGSLADYYRKYSLDTKYQVMAEEELNENIETYEQQLNSLQKYIIGK